LVAVLVAVVADFTVMVAVQTTLVAKLVIMPLIGTMVLAARVELETVDPSASFLTTISVNYTSSRHFRGYCNFYFLRST